VVIVTIMVAVTITIPIAIFVPPPLVGVPPSMVFAPAALPLCVQVPSPFLGLAAALAVFANRLIQFCFRVLNAALALLVIVRVRPGYRNKHCRTQTRRHNRRYSKSFEALYLQAVLLLVRPHGLIKKGASKLPVHPIMQRES
jgi:hypothetical protein